MKKAKPACEDLCQWLRANLGKRALASLTSVDERALAAIAHLLQLYSTCDQPDAGPVLSAFGAAVRCMQPQCQPMAYHAIAWSLDWHVRERLWAEAGLEPLCNPGVCAHEPGGSRR